MRQRFIEGMSRAAATVSVVSTDGPGGRCGVTVSAMTAVSADSEAPSLLVCINRTSAAADAIRTNGVFCVNVLRDEHIGISEIFAGRRKMPSGDRFDCTEWTTLKSAAPAVKDALVAFDCELKQAFLYGSHWILIGELNEITINDGQYPLIYANRAYGIPAPLPHSAPAPQPGGGKKLSFGCSSNYGPFFLGDLLAELQSRFDETEIHLAEGMQSALISAVDTGELDFAITHSHQLSDRFEATPLATLAPFCMLPPSHPLSGDASVSLVELQAFPMVLLDHAPIGDLILSYYAQRNLTPRIAHRVKSLELVRSLVGSGHGYAVLFTKQANNMSYDGKALTVRAISDPLQAMEMAVIRKKGAEASQHATFITEFFQRRYGSVSGDA